MELKNISKTWRKKSIRTRRRLIRFVSPIQIIHFRDRERNHYVVVIQNISGDNTCLFLIEQGDEKPFMNADKALR